MMLDPVVIAFVLGLVLGVVLCIVGLTAHAMRQAPMAMVYSPDGLQARVRAVDAGHWLRNGFTRAWVPPTESES